MRWHDLLFAHWPVSVEALRPLIPPIFEIDTYDGEAWIGVVPFRMTGFRNRIAPVIPWAGAFAEINVRTYVRIGGRGGVYFFSLDTHRRLAVWGARRFFSLPYYRAEIACRNEDEAIAYESNRVHRDAPPARFRGRYAPTSGATAATCGTLDYFLTERYSLYTVDRRGNACVGEIHHAPWPLQPAELDIETNEMTAQIGLALPETKPVLHFARELDVVAWALARLP